MTRPVSPPEPPEKTKSIHFGQQLMARGPITSYQAKEIERANAGLPSVPPTRIERAEEWVLPILGGLVFLAFCLMVILGKAPWQ